MYADKGKIEQVLYNLLDNAIKHTESENNVEVVLKKEKGNIILKVENEGSKIPEEEREKIFERFYRVDKARTREMGGTGLGLSIAKEILDKKETDTVEFKSWVNARNMKEIISYIKEQQEKYFKDKINNKENSYDIDTTYIFKVTKNIVFNILNIKKSVNY